MFFFAPAARVGCTLLTDCSSRPGSINPFWDKFATYSTANQARNVSVGTGRLEKSAESIEVSLNRPTSSHGRRTSRETRVVGMRARPTSSETASCAIWTTNLLVSLLRCAVAVPGKRSTCSARLHTLTERPTGRILFGRLVRRVSRGIGDESHKARTAVDHEEDDM